MGLSSYTQFFQAPLLISEKIAIFFFKPEFDYAVIRL